MARKRDVRGKLVDADIKNAFLAVLSQKPLSDMTMAEVARAADVSRSTLYAHYSSLADIYSAISSELPSTTRTVFDQLDCQKCGKDDGKIPFCAQIRTGDKFKALYKDERFLSVMLEHDTGAIEQWDDFFDTTCISEPQRKALRLFQISGCYSVATSELARTENWESIRKALDCFIEGGLENLKKNF